MFYITTKYTGTLPPATALPVLLKKIYPADNKIDVAAGKPGYQRVEDEAEKYCGCLKRITDIYYDKSDPEEIYSFFGMSKKTFKMTKSAISINNERSVSEKTGIKLLDSYF